MGRWSIEKPHTNISESKVETRCTTENPQTLPSQSQRPRQCLLLTCLELRLVTQHVWSLHPQPVEVLAIAVVVYLKCVYATSYFLPYCCTRELGIGSVNKSWCLCNWLLTHCEAFPKTRKLHISIKENTYCTNETTLTKRDFPIKPDSTTTSCIQKKKTTTYNGIEDVLV